ncbi:G8 domain-containing protein [Leisingera sp. NJS204]|uniref:G8 domain-containing protein n=1 Tax=Leisingera sp. NJS204 TaxID=2508307 RepID=UPI001010E3CA|nr:G8 domain-containing protein [Leisingera sp. NJS204]QAX32121.1 hypothetical protein ETW24_22305 [Leisingera sp. NJS204]
MNAMTNDTMMSHHDMTTPFTNPADATHVAIQSGNWNDPSTWKGGKVPGKDAKVHVPEGVSVEYNSTSNARLEWVRIDGGLDFATDQDTHIRVETFVTGLNSHLTIGTADKPVEADVNTSIVFADGAIDTKIDPDLLSHGLIAQGKVEVHGATKYAYAALDGNAKAGTKTLNFEANTDGWQVGDTLVVMGTQQGKFQDESREIVAIKETSKGVEITLDKALSHDHTTPPGHDLDIFVGNETRNVVFSSENPEGVRGHVMMMHTPDAAVQYAEFSELGRTDKSLPLDVGTNVAARYPLHLHETGTEAGSQMAVLNGNSVHGSPGWGIVQHSSHAAVDFNFVHDIAGAGIVSEDGDETGQWIGNFVTGVPGAGEDFSIARDEHKADFGHSGVAYENQARQIVQHDNIAANANTAWMFRAAETSVDNPDRDALQFDPMPLKDVLNNEEPAIIGFHDNTAIAVETMIDTGHRQSMATTTDLRSDFLRMTAWEVDRVFDVFNYTGEYVIRDGLFIADDDGAGRAIVLPNKHEGTSIIGSHFEGFSTAIYDKGVNNDGVYIGNTFKDVGQKTDSEYYGDKRLQSVDPASLETLDRPVLELDANADLTLGPRNKEVLISGTITDNAGELRLGSNVWAEVSVATRDGIDSNDNDLGQPDPEEMIAINGAMRDGDGWIMPIAIWITDRVTAEHFSYRIDIKLEGYTDEFLEQYEITDFKLPSSKVEIFDGYTEAGGGTPDPKPTPDPDPKPDPDPTPEPTPDPDTGGDAEAVLQVGTATFNQGSRNNWFSTEFAEDIDNPVVIMGPLTSNGGAPAFARVKAATDDGFKMQIEEWDYLNGKHATESVSWVAMSSGTYELEDGRQVTAVQVKTDKNGKATVDFSGFDGEIAVFTQIGSHNASEAITVRNEVSGNDSVEISLQRQQDNSGGAFAPETVYVMAMEVGEGEGLQAGNMTGVKRKASQVDVDPDDFDELAFLASMTSTNGQDPAALRLRDFDSNGISIFAQEEKSADNETWHKREDVSWFAAETGVYDLF